MSGTPQKSELSKAEKAALLILSMEREAAQAILKQLDDSELRALRAAAGNLKEPRPEVMQSVTDEFLGELSKPTALTVSGGDKYVDGLLKESVGEERAKRLSGEGRSSLRALEAIDPKTSALLLEKEHPQAVAALLYSLDEALATKILKHMPAATVVDLVRRVASLSHISPQALRQLEAQLQRSLGDGQAEGSKKKPSGVTRAAALLNGLEQEAAKKVIEDLAIRDKELAEKIKSARFTIDDLSSADVRGLQLVLREVESDKLLIAMKTVSPELREKFLSSVSSRVAESLREELGNLGPVRIKDVENAQRAIVDVALRLQTEGKLQLASRGGEDFV